MDRILYTAGGGAARALQQQSVVSNNLANVATQGFRAQFSAFRAVPVQGEGVPTRVGTVAVTPGIDRSMGALQTTGRPLDVALQARGWLVVQTPQGQALTRQGHLVVDADGLLKTVNGWPVLSDANAPIEIPANAEINIADDGAIMALGGGEQPVGLAEIARLKMVDPGNLPLTPGGDGLVRIAVPPGQPEPFLPPDPSLRLVSGALEGSNVNPTQAMVELIANARSFEMQMQVVQHADRNAERANQLLSANG